MTPQPSLVIFDTNILVRTIRGDAVGKLAAEDALALSPAERPLISVVTVGEIKSFAHRLHWGARKISDLDKLLRELVIADINVAPILDKYAEIDSWSQAKGHKMGKNDLWIAATASVTRSVLLTTDADFDLLHKVYLERIRYDVATGARV